MKEKFKALIKWVQHYSDRPWYPAFVGFLSAIDNWILIVPTDGLVISGVMLAPKRWKQFAWQVPLLSTIGGIAFAAFVGEQGLPYLQSHWPELTTTVYWTWTEDFFAKHGLVVVFLVATTPLAQQPALILAALAQTPYWYLFLVVLAGRMIKYILLSWIAARAPSVLSKLWGLNREMEQAGVPIEEKS